MENWEVIMNCCFDTFRQISELSRSSMDTRFSKIILRFSKIILENPYAFLSILIQIHFSHSFGV